MSNTFRITSTKNGAVTGITVNNAGSGYVPGSLVYFSNNVTPGPPNPLANRNKNDELLLSINASGEVIWHQHNPNEAAKQLVTAIQGNLDNSTVKRGALQRAYLRGLEKCQRLLGSMEPAQVIELLKREIEHRQETSCWNLLIDSLDTNDDT